MGRINGKTNKKRDKICKRIEIVRFWNIKNIENNGQKKERLEKNGL